jgi:hypothetical protein
MEDYQTKRWSMNRYFSYVFIPTLLLILGFAVSLPFMLPQEQRIPATQVSRAIQKILSGKP